MLTAIRAAFGGRRPDGGEAGGVRRDLADSRRALAELEARLARTIGALEEVTAERDGVEGENAALRRRVAELEALAEQPSVGEVTALRRRVAELTGRVAELEAQLLDARRKAHRSAAPHAREKGKERRKKPGRKAGHAGAYRAKPDHVDRTENVPLPACPDCHGKLRKRKTHENFAIEVPPIRPVVIKYVTESGYCPHCRKRSRSHHPDQPSEAGGAAAVALGPNALALAATLKVRHGVAMRRVAEIFQVAFGLCFTAGGLAQALQRLGRRLDNTYQALVDALRVADAVFADETGWRIMRVSAWLWVFCSKDVTIYVVDARRNHEIPLRVLGEGFAGFLHHDGARSYDVLPYLNQTCIPHILRDLDDLAKVKTKGAVRWPRAVAKLLREAMALRRDDGVQTGSDDGSTPSDRIEAKLDRLLVADLTDADNLRMKKRLLRNREVLFPFLYLEEAEATNNRAERQLRPMIVGRKVGAGNRSDDGARAHQILASIIATARQQGHNEIDVLAEAARRQPANHVIERLVPAAARARASP